MLSENSKPCNPNTSIEPVTKDMTAFFPTNNNERLISILMREKKGKWMGGGALCTEGAMLLLVVLAPIDKVFKYVVNDQPKTQGAACGVIISTCCVCISCCVLPPCLLCGCSCVNVWHCCHKPDRFAHIHAGTRVYAHVRPLTHKHVHSHTQHLTSCTIRDILIPQEAVFSTPIG